MTLLKEMPVRVALFFLFFFLISTKISSQEQIHNQIIYGDTLIFDSSFLPLVFDGRNLDILGPLTPESSLMKPLIPPFRISKHRLFEDIHQKNALRKYTYNYLINNYLKQVKYTSADFSGEVETLEKIPSNVFQHIFKIDYDLGINKANKPDRFRPKRRYWIYSGNHKIQLSQNYISDNWYKGGMNHLNLLNMHNMTFNYSKNKFQNNNTVEWRLNVFTNQNDTIRHYRIGDDVIRTYSNFGIQAAKHWYYSTNIEIKTQLFKNFIENAENPISSTFSPFYINAGLLGMRYQIDKAIPKVRGRKINFNADISPLSISYISVMNKNIDSKRFGIEEGQRHLTSFGSTVNARLVYNFNKSVNFTSRFHYFTNYERVTIESENTLTMPINHYFSTTIYLFVRFDDNSNIIPHEKLGYFQYNELLSFGFNYNW